MDIELFLPNYREYFQLLPISIVGILAGVVSYYTAEYKEFKEALKVVITSVFLTIVVYSLLSATDLPYLAKVGISACVGYFGVEKAIELVQKIISLKNNNPHAHKDNKKDV